MINPFPFAVLQCHVACPYESVFNVPHIQYTIVNATHSIPALPSTYTPATLSLACNFNAFICVQSTIRTTTTIVTKQQQQRSNNSNNCARF